MNEIKFGAGQVKNPTPSKVNFWVRVYTVTSCAFLGWMATANIMGPNTKDLLTQILGLANILVVALSPLFGVEVSGRVKAEDVTAINKP